MKKLIIISDFFKDDLSPPGGAELNDDVLFSFLEEKGIVKAKIRSNQFPTNQMLDFLRENRDCRFLISNFANLHFRATAFLAKNCEYFIYEHDYKFHKHRNPLWSKDFVVPTNELININFYKKAKRVVCLSKLHKQIFERNLNLTNLHNTTSSLWEQATLDYLESLSTSEKNNKLAIVDTENPIKRKQECVQYCKDNNIDFDLISSPNYKEFLKILSKYKGIVILPGHPEPTPRVAVEAKMLNCEVYSNFNTLGVAHEDWFDLDGKQLVEQISKINKEALNYMYEMTCQ